MKREPFAGWDFYDNSAVCLTCGTHHLLPKGELPRLRRWLDFLTQHPAPRCETLIAQTKLLSRLAESLLASNSDVKPAYAASAAYTFTLTGLPTDANLLAGRESTSVSNAVNLREDEMIAGFSTTGTTPTTAKQIELHAVSALNDTPTWPDVFDGTDSAETIATSGIKNRICAPLGIAETTATSNQAYPFGLVGLRQFIGDALGLSHVLFLTHNTAVNLNATAANHAFYHTPVYHTITG